MPTSVYRHFTARRANVAKGGLGPWFEQSCAAPGGSWTRRSMSRDSSHSIEQAPSSAHAQSSHARACSHESVYSDTLYL